jgi:hypothetical protein
MHLVLGHKMQRWNTHQLVEGGLLDQPGRLWREIEAALDEEELHFLKQRRIEEVNAQLRAEAAGDSVASAFPPDLEI